VDFTAGGARRAFRRGEPMAYTYEILNASADAGQNPDLEVQTRLFRDGVQVMTDKTPVRPPADLKDPHHLRAAGRLSIGSGAPPGEYVLQIIVTDKLAKSKVTMATQSVDFEIQE
jgi:hypothetical protein